MFHGSVRRSAYLQISCCYSPNNLSIEKGVSSANISRLLDRDKWSPNEIVSRFNCLFNARPPVIEKNPAGNRERKMLQRESRARN